MVWIDEVADQSDSCKYEAVRACTERSVERSKNCMTTLRNVPGIFTQIPKKICFFVLFISITGIIEFISNVSSGINDHLLNNHCYSTLLLLCDTFREDTIYNNIIYNEEEYLY